MTKPLLASKAMLKRAAEIARDQGVRVVIRPDGTIVVDPAPVDSTPNTDEKWSDIQA